MDRLEEEEDSARVVVPSIPQKVLPELKPKQQAAQADEMRKEEERRKKEESDKLAVLLILYRCFFCTFLLCACVLGTLSFVICFSFPLRSSLKFL
jgi:hypothetical protein